MFRGLGHEFGSFGVGALVHEWEPAAAFPSIFPWYRERRPDCVRVFETSDLHASDRSEKVTCPGIGLVFDDGIELTDVQNF